MAKKPGKASLTPRQAGFVKNLKKGETLAEASTNSGYSPKNARQSGHQVLKQIQKKMPQILDDAGLTDKVLIDNYLLPLMNAQETKFFQKDGRVISTRKVEALGIRKDALDLAFKLKGSYAPRDAEDLRGSGPTVIILDLPRPPRNVTPVIEVKE